MSRSVTDIRGDLAVDGDIAVDGDLGRCGDLLVGVLGDVGDSDVEASLLSCLSRATRLSLK